MAYSGIWFGLGVHYQTIKASYDTILRNTFLNLFIEELFYSTGTAFMKLSLLAFYWRIFNVASIRRPIKILVAAVIAWLFARVCIKTAACGVNDRLFFVGTNTVNFVLDLITLILPMPYVQKLQVRQSQKLVVFCMFALGGFIVAVSIALLVVCYKLDSTSPDVTWTISPIVLWAGTEINLGVVTACLPSLRPIFLLIVRGSARPDATKGDSRQFSKTNALKSKAMGMFGSRGHSANMYRGMHAEDEHHPFSIVHDDKNNMDKRYAVDSQTNHESDIHLEELQTPQDRVIVREDIYVKYSSR
ncbi:MAG: hypothetical protein Q9179_002774 [Wetmoreana sp. 5 TL-2023]